MKAMQKKIIENKRWTDQAKFRASDNYVEQAHSFKIKYFHSK